MSNIQFAIITSIVCLLIATWGFFHCKKYIDKGDLSYGLLLIFWCGGFTAMSFFPWMLILSSSK